MSNPTLFISRDPELNWLNALEFGRVFDGQPDSCWRPIDERFAYFVPPRCRRPRGFFVRDFDDFDPFVDELAEIWSGARFDAPLVGLRDAPAGEIILAAATHLGDEPTMNRVYFNAGMHSEGDSALRVWRACLECGDSMAHFAIGYTLFDLERYHEAYAHLRHYVELAPNSSWNWCWLGKAAAAIGETAEAEHAYLRALELTAAGDLETDAVELLATLAGRRGAGLSDDEIPF